MQDTMNDETPLTYNERPTAKALGAFIFTSRWLQAPIYLGLIAAQVVYVVVFIIDLYGLIADDVIGELLNGHHPDEAVIMLGVLGLIDVAMIANLLIMVIVGGYETFVSKINLSEHPDQPEWLSHVNANVLKVKLAMAIIGISSIHLLKTFIEVGNMQDGVATSVLEDSHGVTWDGALWQVIIHMSFILSALGLAWIDRMQAPQRAALQAYAAQHPQTVVLAPSVPGYPEQRPGDDRPTS